MIKSLLVYILNVYNKKNVFFKLGSINFFGLNTLTFFKKIASFQYKIKNYLK
jgi:hypothetical protein